MDKPLTFSFRKIEIKTVERADLECTTFGNYLLYVEVLPAFYFNVPSVRCYNLGSNENKITQPPIIYSSQL